MRGDAAVPCTPWTESSSSPLTPRPRLGSLHKKNSPCVVWCTWSPTSCCMLLLCCVLRTPKCWPTPWPSCTERTAASAAALALHSWPSLAAACREQRRRQLLHSQRARAALWALCTCRCSPCAASPCLLALLDAPARTAAPACLRTTTRPSEIQTKTKRKQRIESKSTAPRARGGKGLHSQRIHGTRSQISITKS